MDIQYRELFSIRFKHEYFGGECNVLTLTPTAECEQMLQRYRCRFRPAAGGGSVWYGSHQGVSLLKSFAERQPFQFTVTNTDPAFSLYTDLGASSLSPDEALYWYSNIQNYNFGLPAESARLLHNPQVAAHALPVKGLILRHQFNAPQKGKVFAVVDAVDPDIKLEVNAPPDPFQTCSLDLSSLPEGRYRLLLDTREMLDFILSAQNPSALWGRVEIFASGPSLPTANRVIAPYGAAEPKTFLIDFASQLTTWRYFIVGQAPRGQSAGVNLINHKVVGKPAPKKIPPPEFLKPSPVKLADSDAWMFESSDPIKLFAQPGSEHSFHLLNKDQADDADGIKLAYASASNTRAQQSKGGVRLVSDIIQYI